MNELLWIAQIVLAGIFLFTGVGKIVAYRRMINLLQSRWSGGPIGIPRPVAALLGLLEVAAAVGLLLPESLTPSSLAPDYLLVRLSAGGLAVLMVATGIYHLRRRETAAPSVSLFLLALFVIVGRWPH